MLLANFEIVPGIVVDNNDPLGLGRVKAVAPCLFDNSTMENDDLIWVNPFCMNGQQTFSKLRPDSKIWILYNKENYFEYWYIPMFEFNNTFPTDGNDDSDVLISRSSGGSKINMYYSPKTGINIKNGTTHYLQLGPNGDTVLANEYGGINISGEGCVYIGSAYMADDSGSIQSAIEQGRAIGDGGLPKKIYKAVYGEALVKKLQNLSAGLNACAQGLNGNWLITNTPGNALAACAKELSDNLDTILSGKVYLCMD